MHNPTLYLIVTTYKNTFKKWLRNPLKFLGVLIWMGFILWGFMQYPELLSGFGIVTPQGFVALLSIFNIYMSGPSLLTYFKRKGIVFTHADVNLVFPTPISPKSALIYGLSKTMIVNILFTIAMFVVGVVGFHIPILSAILYYGLSLLIGDVGEYALATIFYGSETLSDNFKKAIRYGVYALMMVVLLWVSITFMNEGISKEVVYDILGHPIILLIPLIGWKIGLAHFVILGYTPIRLISTLCFVFGSLALFVYAKTMKMRGDYYEDALTFADDYQIALDKSSKGGLGFVGKKEKVKKTKTVLKGAGASAIFYKHVLEFTKKHHFPIRYRDLLVLMVGCILAYFMKVEPFENMKAIMPLALMGFQLYFKNIFSQILQWHYDFDHYLIYLIPDSNLKKVFYATLITHLTGLIQTVFLFLPMGIYLRWPIYHLLLSMLLMTLLRAASLYFSIFFKEIIGSYLGKVLEGFVSMLSEMVILGVPLLIIGIWVSVAPDYAYVAYGVLSVYYIVISCISLIVIGRVLTHTESIAK